MSEVENQPQKEKYWQSSVAGVAAFYAGLSAPGHVEYTSLATNSGKLSGLVNAVADFNDLLTSFTPARGHGSEFGLVLGLGLAAGFGAYSYIRHRKTKTPHP